MAPWVRHLGLLSFGTAFAYEVKKHDLYGSPDQFLRLAEVKTFQECIRCVHLCVLEKVTNENRSGYGPKIGNFRDFLSLSKSARKLPESL